MERKSFFASAFCFTELAFSADKKEKQTQGGEEC